MRIFAFLVALLCLTSPSEAREFVKCPRYSEIFTTIRPVADERLIGIFHDVLGRTGYTKYIFALCESDSFSPGMMPLSDDDLTVAIILPRIITRFSDIVIKGVIAHELGHVPRLGQKTTQQLEREVDAVAIRWVGKEALVLSLRMMLNNIERLPWWMQDIGELSLKDRLKILEFVPAPNPYAI